MFKNCLSFLQEQRGAIFVEALLIIPVVTIFAIGVIEFGNVFWQRHQMENGVRDAARYWARCRPGFSCSDTVAKNIALYGSPTNTGVPRVPGWDDPSTITLSPATVAGFPSDASAYFPVVVGATIPYTASPLFAALQIPQISLSVRHVQRYIGW